MLFSKYETLFNKLYPSWPILLWNDAWWPTSSEVISISCECLTLAYSPVRGLYIGLYIIQASWENRLFPVGGLVCNWCWIFFFCHCFEQNGVSGAPVLHWLHCHLWGRECSQLSGGSACHHRQPFWTMPKWLQSHLLEKLMQPAIRCVS